MSLARNTVWNAAGSLAPALLTVVLTPVLINKLGLEAYGLVSVFVLMEVALAVISSGFASALQRGLVRLGEAADPGARAAFAQRYRRRFQLAGLAVSGGLVVLAWPLAAWWLNLRELGIGTTVIALCLVALRIGFTLPWTVHQATLYALERQREANIGHLLNSVGGGILVLVAVLATGSIIAFCAVQAAVSALVVTWQGQRARIFLGPVGDLRSDIDVGRFSTTTINNGAWMLLSICDRSVLSRMVLVEQLGGYHAGAAAARILQQLLGAYQVAIFPTLCRQVGQRQRLAREVGRGLVLTALLASAIGGALILATVDFLQVWLRNTEAVRQGSAILPLAVLAMSSSALSGIYGQLAVAADRLRVTITFYLIGLLVVPPAMVWAVWQAGPVGVAWVWLGFTALQLLVFAVLGYVSFLPRSSALRHLLMLLLALSYGIASAVAGRYLGLWLASEWALGRLLVAAVVGSTLLLLVGWLYRRQLKVAVVAE